MTRLNSDGGCRVKRCKPSEDVCLEHSRPLKGARYCEDGREWCRHGYAILNNTRSVEIDGERRVHVERYCYGCGMRMGLGPANDADPRVAVEVRAAEIASIGRDAASMWLSNEMSDSERDGWETHMRDWDHIRIEGAEWAGYLARCIATHGDE